MKALCSIVTMPEFARFSVFNVGIAAKANESTVVISLSTKQKGEYLIDIDEKGQLQDF